MGRLFLKTFSLLAILIFIGACVQKGEVELETPRQPIAPALDIQEEAQEGGQEGVPEQPTGPLSVELSKSAQFGSPSGSFLFRVDVTGGTAPYQDPKMTCRVFPHPDYPNASCPFFNPSQPRREPSVYYVFDAFFQKGFYLIEASIIDDEGNTRIKSINLEPNEFP